MNQREHLKVAMARRLARLKEANQASDQETERQQQQLRQSIDIINQLINENAHRPESMRLLRKILRERAELQIIRHWDENSLSG